MLFLLLRRIFQRHLGLHLAIPVIVVALTSMLAEGIAARRTGTPLDWHYFWAHWLVARAWELLAVYISFAWVVAVSIKRAGEVRTARVDQLRDILPGSARYFAIGTIPLREWFEPNSQIYLATIIRHKHCDPNFRHERVLLFYTSRELKALQASYLDEPFAKGIAAIHKLFDVPLAYLGPDEMRGILLALDENTLKILHCKKPMLTLVRRFVPIIPRPWTIRRKPRMLPYALIEKSSGACILRFTKQANALTLDEVNSPEEVAAHKIFADRLCAKIHGSANKLKEEFKFINYLFPGAG